MSPVLFSWVLRRNRYLATCAPQADADWKAAVCTGDTLAADMDQGPVTAILSNQQVRAAVPSAPEQPVLPLCACLDGCLRAVLASVSRRSVNPMHCWLPSTSPAPGPNGIALWCSHWQQQRHACPPPARRAESLSYMLHLQGVLCGPLPAREESSSEEADLALLQHQFSPQLMALLQGLR